MSSRKRTIRDNYGDNSASPQRRTKIKREIIKTLNIENKALDLYNWSGRGSYSFVYNGNYNGKNCTIKFVRDIRNDSEGALMKKASQFEGRTRHFIKYIGHELCNDSSVCFVEDSGFKETYKLAIIMKTYENTAIDALFSQDITEEIKKNIYAQIFLATMTFHSLLGYKHNDVKIENFLYYKQRMPRYGAIQYYCYIITYDNEGDIKKYYIYLKKINYGIVIGDYGNAIVVRDSKDLIEDFAAIQDIGLTTINDWISARNIKKGNVTVRNSHDYGDYIMRFIQDYDLFDNFNNYEEYPRIKPLKTYNIYIPPKLSQTLPQGLSLSGGNKTKLVKKLLTDADCFKIGKMLNPKTNRCINEKLVKQPKPVKPPKKVAEQQVKKPKKAKSQSLSSLPRK